MLWNKQKSAIISLEGLHWLVHASLYSWQGSHSMSLYYHVPPDLRLHSPFFTFPEWNDYAKLNKLLTMNTK